MKTERSLQHRIATRWPRVANVATASVLRLPVGSRPRRTLLERIARDAFDAWMRDDFEELTRAADDPEVEVRIKQLPDNTVGFDDVYYGPDGHCKVMEEWSEAWKSWHAELDQVIEVEHNKVLFTGPHFGVGLSSGAELEEYGAILYTFRRGKIIRVDGFFGSDKPAVMEAIGAVIDGSAAA